MGIYIFISILIILTLRVVYKTATSAIKARDEINKHLALDMEMRKISEHMSDWYRRNGNIGNNMDIMMLFKHKSGKFYQIGLIPNIGSGVITHPSIKDKRKIIKDIKKTFHNQLRSIIREERLKELLNK